MKVIKSVTVTEDILISSNIPEDDYPLWDANETYKVDDQVIYNHKIYKLILQHDVPPTPPDIDQEHWVDMGATNRYRMFDGIISSESSNLGGITFTLRPNQVVNGIAFLNINASTVRVVVNDVVQGTVYDRTRELRVSNEVVDWWSYFFAPLQELNDLTTALFLDLPNIPTATITVYIQSGGAEVSVGEVVFGVQSNIGRTNINTAIGIKSYSKKETDEFGRVTVVPRKNSKYAEYDIDIDNWDLARVQRFFSDIDSLPCLFIGHPDMEELIVYGFYSDFKAVIQFLSVSKCNLRVEGLI